MEDFGAAAQRLAERALADRQDHEFLKVEAVVGVLAAVDDVHHRHRHLHRPRAAEVAVERQARLLGGGLGHRHRHREQRIGAEARLVFGAVELDQRLIDEGLLLRIKTDDRLGDLAIDVFDRPRHALAEVARGIAVTQFDGFARTGRGARGHGGAPHHARLEQDVAFDGGVAARIENLAGDDIDNGAHGCSFTLVITVDDLRRPACS